MKLIIRYEDSVQVLELNDKDTDDLWVSLSLTGEELSQEEKEERIQEAFEEKFNRPDYNNWHKYNRHIGRTKARQNEDGDEIDTSEPLMSEVRDKSVFMKDEIDREKREEYERVCNRVRYILRRSPNIAETYIAVVIDGMKVQDYAASIGVSDPDLIYKWLERAEKRLQKFSKKCQILPSDVATW